MVDQKNHIVTIEEQKLWKILEEVKDPEVPVLSIIDLGIVREIKLTSPLSISNGEGQGVRITITPTYSGCPAMDVIQMDIRLKLVGHGYKKCRDTAIAFSCMDNRLDDRRRKKKIKRIWNCAT